MRATPYTHAVIFGMMLLLDLVLITRPVHAFGEEDDEDNSQEILDAIAIIAASVATLQNTVNDLSSAISHVNATVNGLDSKISDINATVNEVQSAVNAIDDINATVNSVQERVESVENKTCSIQMAVEGLDDINATVNELQGQVEGVENKTRSIELAVEVIEDDVSFLRFPRTAFLTSELCMLNAQTRSIVQSVLCCDPTSLVC